MPENAPDCPKAKREYYGVNIALDKRFSNSWLGGISYTWSRNAGNYSGLASGDEYGRASPNVERYFDLWYLAFDSNMDPIDGLMPGDRPHYFKLYGSYVTPFGLTAGLVVNAMSGVVTSTEWAMDVQGYLPYNRNDLGRSPFLWFANAYLAYEFKLGGKSLQIGGCHHFGETVIAHVPEQPQFPDLWQIGRSHGFLRLIIVKISIDEPSKQSTAPQSCGLINVCAVIERRSALPCFYIALLIS